MPYHDDASKPDTVSAMAGMSGAAGTRFKVPKPSARKAPLLTCGNSDTPLVKVACTSPEITSVIEGGVPRYGTWTILVPAATLNAAIAICAAPPTPAEEKFNWPGLAFA